MSGAGQLTVEEIQEAFYNFDENRSFTLSMEELRRIVGEEGEPIPDVTCFLFFFLSFPSSYFSIVLEKDFFFLILILGVISGAGFSC